MSNQGGDAALIRIEVAYARPADQDLVELSVPAGTTVLQAIQRSGLPERRPELTAASLEGHVGVFGRHVRLDRELSAGDRVEIYRPLRIDPKELRRQRARHGLG